jgi:hypothetical protein
MWNPNPRPRPRPSPSTVTGYVVVDLSDLDPWCHRTDFEARKRLDEINRVPPGATVCIRTGALQEPGPFMFGDVNLTTVRVVVEGSTADAVRAWVREIKAALRDHA